MYKPGGTHIFIDVELEDDSMPESLDMLDILIFASEKAGSKVLDHSMETFDSQMHSMSYTICLLLSESHASVHTWPEHNFLSIDFFFCGSADWRKAISIVESKLKFKKFHIQKHRRGV